MPKIESPQDLVSETHELETRSSGRFTQYEQDEKLWHLEKYILEETSSVSKAKRQAFPTFTGNDPRNLADLLMGMLVQHPVEPHGDIYEPTTTTQDDELSIHERFAVGLWRQVDKLRAARAQLPFQTDLSWFLCLRGGAFIRYWVLKTDKQYPFRIDIWDPWDCVYKMGDTGLSFVCHHYQAPRDAVADEWEIDELDADSEGTVEVWDGWWKADGRVFNGVAIGEGAGDSMSKKKGWATAGRFPEDMTAKRKIREIPVHVSRSLGAPAGPRAGQGGSKQWELDQWDSIYGPNREMYAQYNRIATLYSLVIRDGPLGMLHHQTNKPVPKLEEAIGPLSLVQTPGDLKRVTPVQMAAEVKEMFAAVSGHVQRGGAPFSAYGQTPFQLSGIALSQLQGALEIRTTRLSHALCTAHEVATDGIIEQIIALNRNVTLEGIDRRQHPFLRDFKAQELKVKYHMEFRHRTDLPIHRMQEANIAAIWQNLGVSLLHIYDELLHFPDPNWEYRRKLMEMADQNPTLMALKMAEEFDRRALAAEGANDLRLAAKLYTYRDIVLQQLQNTQLQAAQQQAAAKLPPPQAGSPEMFGVQSAFTPSAQQMPREAQE